MEDKIEVTDASGQGGFNPNSDEFVSRLIDAVRREPCLYDPNHEHYGNKHASAQYRANVWQRLCDDLQFPEEPHALQIQWKRVRDRYVRERKKRKAHTGPAEPPVDLNNPNVSAAVRHYESMKWIDDFLADPPTTSSL
ncbi:BESS motif family protein [Aphelenchoides avenae]|nr:BESS motif family protein [Aphelenchus avenae]